MTSIIKFIKQVKMNHSIPFHKDINLLILALLSNCFALNLSIL